MADYDPRLDAYIGQAADFARPILQFLREQVHHSCPDIRETIKWGMPFFEYKGKPLCHMAAFKAHCAFGFWKLAPDRVEGDASKARRGAAMGNFGRLETLADLPSARDLGDRIRAAIEAQEVSGKAGRRDRKARPVPSMPDDLASGLAGNVAAQASFEALTPSRRREYIEWLAEAKTAVTRARRLAQALAWIAEGKARNWKYESSKK